jgi:hypothetical protein
MVLKTEIIIMLDEITSDSSKLAAYLKKDITWVSKNYAIFIVNSWSVIIVILCSFCLRLLAIMSTFFETIVRISNVYSLLNIANLLIIFKIVSIYSTNLYASGGSSLILYLWLSIHLTTVTSIKFLSIPDYSTLSDISESKRSFSRI